MADESSAHILLKYKWNGTQFELKVSPSATVQELKLFICSQTRVLPTRQKIVGLVKGKIPGDHELLCDVLCGRVCCTFLLIGVPEEDVVKDWDPSLIPDVLSNKSPLQLTIGELNRDPEVQRTLDMKAKELELYFISPVRQGKKLLVLDLDYTLFDIKGTASDFHQLCRPFLHEFLAAVYEHYDICVWSQTNWTHLEAKLTEMGMLTHHTYKISFVLDIRSMFRVTANGGGKLTRHYIKPLEIIWRLIPQFTPANTIHVDDLARNFALNPKNGLRIPQWRYSARARESDCELRLLARYLLILANEEDLTRLDHSEWRKYLAEH